MVDADVERCVNLRLSEREGAPEFASSLACVKEAQTLDVEVRLWFERTYAGFFSLKYGKPDTEFVTN